jgi:hypothetical protein
VWLRFTATLLLTHTDVVAFYTTGTVNISDSQIHSTVLMTRFIWEQPLCYHGGLIHRPHGLAVFESWITTPLSTPTGGEFITCAV